jgi:transcriptional regulator with PAS, ATPase and Fis domain
MLVEYFIQRHARRMGKSIRSIDKSTLELFQSYAWPGNIRELQNVIERSVILSSSEVLRLDKSLLPSASSERPVPVQTSITSEDERGEERKIIEAALARSKGRVEGPGGAAAKLGIPSSTLRSKIKTLKISKTQFKYR